MTAYSGYHFQKPINDWPRAAAILPNGTWIKYLDNVQALDEAKRVNPGLKTVLRHFDGGWQQFDFANHTERRAHARAFLLSFVDGTFMNYAHNVDAIEELNEYNAASHTPTDVAKRVEWVRAVSEEWAAIKSSDSRLSHIRLVVGNVPIGNDLPLEAARIVQQYGNIAAYHPYVPTKQGQVRPDEWRWYSGRWTEMDARYREAGITVDWLMTEAGPIGYTGDHLGPNDGWRHSDVCNGDVDQLLAVCKYWMDKTAQWNATHGGRALGQVLYNSGGADNEWKLFEIAQPVMDQVAAFNRDYVPPAVQPPDPPDPDPPTPSRIVDYVDELESDTSSQFYPYDTRPLSAIENIVIHHSVGLPTNPPESIHIGHINRGWPRIGYHFYILGDGTIYKTNNLTTHSFHAGDVNRSSIGVCLAGDFTNVHPSVAQLDSARYLLAWLNSALGDKALLKHRDVSATQCPGNTWEAWWAQLTEEPVDPEPEPRKYHRTAHLLPQDATLNEMEAVLHAAYGERQTVLFSADDAFSKPPEITGRTVYVWEVERVAGSKEALQKWVATHYAPVPANVRYRRIKDLFVADRWDAPIGTKAERAGDKMPPGDWVVSTEFNQRYQIVSGGSFHRHTGWDLNNQSPYWDSDRNMPIRACANGRVIHMVEFPDSSSWGKVIITEHVKPDGQVVHSRHAHMAEFAEGLEVGHWIKRGTLLGTTGRTNVPGGSYHHHWDISLSGVLVNDPGHWCGDNAGCVATHYVNPGLFVQANR